MSFLKELQSLLGKYNCKITTRDHWMGYPEDGDDVRMTIEFNNYRDGSDIDLGTWVSAENHGGVNE